MLFFLWSEYLGLLLALPLLVAGYVWLLRRRNKSAVRYSSLGVVRAAAAGRSWRRHVPPALLLLALTSLVLASSRPIAKVPLPWARTTIMLAMDVSLSMRVNDVQPNRIVAAQEAAKTFLKELPKHVEVGLITFAGSTEVAQRATLDRQALVTAIDAIHLQRGTAVGNAIVMCLAELFPDHGIDIGEMTFGGGNAWGGGGSTRRLQGRSLDDKVKPTPKQIVPVPPASYTAASIILLTDGARTTGIDTLEAAKMAADRGVRVDVVGLGVVNGEVNSGWGGMSYYLRLDEPTLREVARMTGGEYFHAGTAEHLQTVYQKLGSRMQVVTRETEVTSLFALLSALLMLTAGVLSLVWFRRID